MKYGTVAFLIETIVRTAAAADLTPSIVTALGAVSLRGER